MQLLLFGLILLMSATSAAQLNSRNSADVGFTSNANLSTDDAKSDFYYRLSSSNRLPVADQMLNLKLSYVDYLEQNANDSLALNIQDQWGDLKQTLFTAGIAGQYFPNGSAGTTETAFNNFGLNFNAAKGWQKKAVEGDFGAGYRMRYYPSFNGRNDHNAFAFGSLNYEANDRLTLVGYSEGGATLSSLSEYSRIYAELSGSAEYKLPDRWLWTNELTLGRSYFVNRSVTTQTRVINKRRSGLQTSTANERYTAVTFASEALRSQSESFKWGAGGTFVNQGSLSGFQDYSVLTIEAKLILSF